MNETEQSIEQSIQAKGLDAPRITPPMVDAELLAATVQFHRFPGTTVTVAAVQLENGFVVVGKSAAASLENFDEEIGKRAALNDARSQLWPLLGFRLRETLSRNGRSA